MDWWDDKFDRDELGLDPEEDLEEDEDCEEEEDEEECHNSDFPY